MVLKKCPKCHRGVNVDTSLDEITCLHCGTECKISHRLSTEKNRRHVGGISLYIPPEPKTPVKDRVIEYVKKFPGCTVTDISEGIDYSKSHVRRAVLTLSDLLDVRVVHIGKRSKWFVYMKGLES
jgi:DNA-directed RNA polymerase subunit RPC12/RpoP